MVERPIKKSERQTAAANDVVKPAETVSSTDEGADINQTSEERKVAKPQLAKDKTKGNERKKQQKDEQSSTASVNPALMRGPKPTKPKPPVIKPQEATQSDTAAEPE